MRRVDGDIELFLDVGVFVQPLVKLARFFAEGAADGVAVLVLKTAGKGVTDGGIAGWLQNDMFLIQVDQHVVVGIRLRFLGEGSRTPWRRGEDCGGRHASLQAATSTISPVASVDDRNDRRLRSGGPLRRSGSEDSFRNSLEGSTILSIVSLFSAVVKLP